MPVWYCNSFSTVLCQQQKTCRWQTNKAINTGDSPIWPDTIYKCLDVIRSSSVLNGNRLSSHWVFCYWLFLAFEFIIALASTSRIKIHEKKRKREKKTADVKMMKWWNSICYESFCFIGRRELNLSTEDRKIDALNDKIYLCGSFTISTLHRHPPDLTCMYAGMRFINHKSTRHFIQSKRKKKEIPKTDNVCCWESTMPIKRCQSQSQCRVFIIQIFMCVRVRFHPTVRVRAMSGT